MKIPLFPVCSPAHLDKSDHLLLSIRLPEIFFFLCDDAWGKNILEFTQGRIVFTSHTRTLTSLSIFLLFILSVRRVPPRFSIPPTNQEVMPGGSVNLTCVAVGSPMPFVKWTMGEVELTKEEEMPLGRNVLEVTNIRESGNYTCVAISSLGMIEATAQVTVKGELEVL